MEKRNESINKSGDYQKFCEKYGLPNCNKEVTKWILEELDNQNENQ